MSKRISQEETIVEFFNTADPAKVETVFNIIKGVVKRRLNKPVAVKPAKAPKPPKTTTVATSAAPVTIEAAAA